MKKIWWGVLISCISASGSFWQDSAAERLHDPGADLPDRLKQHSGDDSSGNLFLSEFAENGFTWTGADVSMPAVPEINSFDFRIPESVRSPVGIPETDGSGSWISERTGTDPGKPDLSFRYMIFLSSSIPELTRLDIYRSFCGRNDAVLLYRGLSTGTGFQKGTERSNDEHAASGSEYFRRTAGSDLFSRLTEMQREAASVCSGGLNIRIEPRLFRYFGIDAVPYLVTSDPDGGYTRYAGAAVLHRVVKQEKSYSGALPPDSGSASQGKIRTSPSRYGPVYEIAEMSLTEYLAARFSGLDWGRMKREAADRFFERPAGYHLPSRLSCSPEKREPAKRIIDPVMVLRRDLADHEGRVLYPAGTKVNPLSYRDFRRFVFVFNPAFPEEIRAVEEYRRVRSVPSSMAVNIITEIRGREEWEKLGALRKRLGKIFLLRQDIAERFSLESTPAVIYQEGRDLVLESVPPAAGEFSSENAHSAAGSGKRVAADDELH